MGGATSKKRDTIAMWKNCGYIFSCIAHSLDVQYSHVLLEILTAHHFPFVVYISTQHIFKSEKISVRKCFTKHMRMQTFSKNVYGALQIH